MDGAVTAAQDAGRWRESRVPKLVFGAEESIGDIIMIYFRLYHTNNINNNF